MRFILTPLLSSSSNLKAFTIRIGVVVLPAILFGISCNYTDVGQFKKPTRCYLIKTDDISLAGSFHIQTDTFIYNSNNKVIAMIRFQPQKLVSIYSYDLKGNIVKALGEQNSVNSYMYDTNNNIVRKDIMAKSPADYYTYEYNSSGQLVTSNFTFYAYDGTQGHIVTHYLYPNESTRNPAGTTDGSDFLPYTMTFEYDNNPNPNKQFFPSIEPDNNLTKAISKIGVYEQAISYTYEYNTEGYPITRTSSYGEIRYYSYNCK